MGIDILDYADYCGIGDRMIVTSHEMGLHNMVPVERLKLIYNSADVFWKPCASEGWGLSLHEAMACAIPSIAPRSSALAEWPNGAIEYVEVMPNMPFVNTSMVNTIMDTPDMESFITAAEKLYNDKDYRKDLGFKGFKRATQARFKWEAIAVQFGAIFNTLLKERNT